MKLSEVIKITSAEVLKDFDNDFDTKISTDTRTIQKGELYLPLKGDNFDGENFVDTAIEKGAAATFVTKNTNLSIPTFKVKNTLTAYLELANNRRHQLNCKVVAITGSSGKTTTKEMISAVLSEKYRVFKTPLNHNNEIGLCQTIFEAPDDTEILVLEMGMRGFGEIDILSKYAEPNISVITNVGTAHIGRLGSRENIAKAKCEIVNYQKGGVVIANDDELIKKELNFDGKKIFYSLEGVKVINKDINGSIYEYDNKEYELNVSGDYNILNSLSAINIGYELGLSYEKIKRGLKNYKPIEKRWEAVEKDGYRIINDSYNANPESMKAFINTVLELYDNYILVLADMGELGKDEKNYHSQIGQFINNHKKINHDTLVLTIGELSQNITNAISNCKSVNFKNTEECVNYIKNNVSKSKTIFLKGSRAMKLENLINLI